MTNDIIKILNLKGYDIDLTKSFLDNDDLVNVKIHIYLNQRILLCPFCESKTKIKEYKIKKLTHALFIDVECNLIFHQRRMICTCCNKTFMENNPFSVRGHKADIQTEVSILEQLKNFKTTFKEVADMYHLSTTTVVRIFDARVQLKRHPLTKWVSMDEFYSRKLSTTGYCFTLFDPITRTVLDILPSRHKRILTDYFARIPIIERKKVQYISIDMWDSYKDVAKRAFPNAIIAVDSFHVIKHLNKAMDDVRKRIMKRYEESKYDDLGYYRLLKKFHFFFTKDMDKIKFNPKKSKKYSYLHDKYGMLDKLLSIDDELKQAYFLKEMYREFNLCSYYHETHEKLNDILEIFKTHAIPEYWEFIHMVENWKEEICNSFKIVENKRLSNGPIESLNSRTKILLKNACGYSNFNRFKNRLMFSMNKHEPINGNYSNNSYNRIGKLRGKYKK